MQPLPDHVSAVTAPTELGGVLRAPFDLSPVPMALLDRTGHVLRANYGIAALLGQAPEEIVGQHWTVFGGTDDQPAIERVLEKLLEGSREILASREVRYERPDGETAVFTAATSAVTDEGTPLLLVQLTDLGQHQSPSAALDQAQQRRDDVAAAVSSGDDALVATDRSGVITTWTPAMADLLGWTPSEAIGRPMPSLFLGGAGAPSATSSTSRWRACTSRGSRACLPTRIAAPSWRSTWMAVSCSIRTAAVSASRRGSAATTPRHPTRACGGWLPSSGCSRACAP